jgi:O-antigen/teichoic acid export membrane protein
MLTSHQKSTGTQNTVVVASLVCAFVFSPAVIAMSGPLGYGSASIALALCTVGLAVAWLSWKRYSQLTIPSIEAAAVRPLLRASPQTR